ncbi:MAG: 3-keto-5-aminohexanoate cleavage protein [Candidatus Hydrogenedentes bacterium]|nr:3-keto-5-aminohexanoate cleavage protein [Candidatus Hydrogenedentota bacterium]
MDKTIVTCALTGAQQGKDANPNLPEQPEEIIAQATEASYALEMAADSKVANDTADTLESLAGSLDVVKQTARQSLEAVQQVLETVPSPA